MTPDFARMTRDDLIGLVQTDAYRAFKIGVFDIDGVLRGKYLHRDKLVSVLKSGIGFCDVVLGWDVDDQLYDNGVYTGWHTGYPDAEARLVPETARPIPFEPGTLLVLGEFAGRAEEVCPRAVLRRVLERGREMGFLAKAGVEFEFFVFDETPDSIRAKGYRDLKPFTPGAFGYSVLRSGVQAELHHEILETCEVMRMPIEGLHTETGPGVLEAALQVEDALEAADRAALFKTIVKTIAQRRGLMASFMAKWSPHHAGASGHIHVSLTDLAGAPMFHRKDAPMGMSEIMRWFLGGQQRLMPELLAMIACTVNSYKRLIPGYWAPTGAAWGVENRTASLRAIAGGPKSQRVEYRVAAADIHPHIALAAAIGSGLWGVEHRIEPTEPVTGNAYDQAMPEALRFPASLGEAARRLQASAAAQALFGPAFVEHYANSRTWEQRQFDRAITGWELERYFEII
jgi:glutamine synthetase